VNTSQSASCANIATTLREPLATPSESSQSRVKHRSRSEAYPSPSVFGAAYSTRSISKYSSTAARANFQTRRSTRTPTDLTLHEGAPCLACTGFTSDAGLRNVDGGAQQNGRRKKSVTTTEFSKSGKRDLNPRPSPWQFVARQIRHPMTASRAVRIRAIPQDCPLVRARRTAKRSHEHPQTFGPHYTKSLHQLPASLFRP
jgi:hypothetical protein